jgi:GT2 family glycosyltransferase
MTVHVLMPVFNRLQMTRQMIDNLRAQQLDEALRIVVVDDGSTDGTAEWLDAQPDVVAVRGNGHLWWGGAIHAGLERVEQSQPADTDWVLWVNNDTRIEPRFVQSLLDAARVHSPAAVGSVIRNQMPPHEVLSIGPRIDAWRLLVTDRLDASGAVAATTQGQAIEVDALSGRGVLFPLQALRAAGGMRPRALPHYLADYEVSLRVRAAGWRLLVSPSAAVLSGEDYGSTYRAKSLRERFLSLRSPTYLPAIGSFWWTASSGIQRLSLPFRLAAFLIFPRLRRTQ